MTSTTRGPLLARHRDRGSVLVITLILVTVCAVMVGGTMTYVQTVLKSHKSVADKSATVETASSAMRMAMLMQASAGPSSCINQSDYPAKTFDVNGIPVTLQCTVLSSIDNGRGRYAVIGTQTDPARRALSGFVGTGGTAKDIDGHVFLNGGDLSTYTSDILVKGTNANGYRVELSNNTTPATGASPSTTPAGARYRVGTTTVGCDGAASMTDGYLKGLSVIDGKTYTHRTPVCSTSTSQPTSNNVPWWNRAGDDPNPNDGVAQWVYPRLPQLPTYDRDGKYVDLTSTCRMYYPGYYDSALTLDGTGGKQFYFASGIYKFDSTLTIRNGAKVVFGSGRISGCAVDSDLALAPTAMNNHDITGKGATILLDKAGKISLQSSSLTINRRVSTPATRGSEGVSIRTVNLGTSSATLQVPRDTVQIGEYPCVQTSPGTCATPQTEDPSNGANAKDVGVYQLALPTKPTTYMKYSGSSLGHADDAVLVDFTSTTSQDASSFDAEGYVFVPNAQFSLKTPSSGAYQGAYSFLVNGGLAASRVNLDAKALPTTPSENWFVGVASQSVQLRVALTTTAQPVGGAAPAVSRAIVEVRSDGSYAINSWVVQSGANGVATPVSTSTTSTTTTVAPTTTTTVPCPSITGWKAQFYNSSDLSGPVVLCRNDADVNFNWGAGGPGNPVGVDGFSARWTKTINVAAGTYRFTYGADDGFRLLVDGNVVADCWCEQAYGTQTVDVPLTAGDHIVMFEYHDISGNAQLSLSYALTATTTTTAAPTTTTTTTTTTTVAPTTTTTVAPGATCPTIPTGSWKAEYFSGTALAGTRVLCAAEATIDKNWGTTAPGVGLAADQYSVRWTQTTTYTAGTHRIIVGSDDGIRITVDGLLVYNDWITHAYTVGLVDVNLTAGSHTIVVEYYEGYGDARAFLSMTPLANACPTITGWKAEFYNSTNFSGVRVACQDVATIDVDWGTGIPAPGAVADNFSVRYTRAATFTSGIQRFTLGADNSINLYVDGVVKGSWSSGPYSETTVDVPITAGSHTLMVEFVENAGSARAKLAWTPVDAACPGTINGWKAEFYEGTNLGGGRFLCRDDSSINVDWGLNGPGSGLPTDYFSARWTKTQTFTAGTYKFTLGSDDGVRLYVDGTLVKDDWADHAYQTVTANVSLTAGSHTIVLEYHESGGYAQVDLTMEQTTCATTTNWTAAYYATGDLTGPIVLCRDEVSVSNDWGTGSPTNGGVVPSDNFSARYTRTINFTAGTYRFTVGSDDGARLYVDGTLVHDRWGQRTYSTSFAEVALTAGNHTISLQYQELYSSARVTLSYAATACAGVTSGWRGEYYDNADFTGTLRCRTDAAINFNWGTGAPISGMGADYYSVRWSKTVTFAGGTYRFRAQVDDGYTLYVDGVAVDSASFASTYTDDVVLTPGQHLVTIEYNENLLSAKMIFDWTPVAQYVRVQLSTTDYLQLAEVQVNGYNSSGSLALRSQGRTAKQVSTLNGTAVAGRAVDGTTNGNYNSGSVSHTDYEVNPWWQVDLSVLLGESKFGIDNIKIFNRTDCCGNRLLNAKVFLSTKDMSSMTYAQILADPTIVQTTVSSLSGTRPEWQESFIATS